MCIFVYFQGRQTDPPPPETDALTAIYVYLVYIYVNFRVYLVYFCVFLGETDRPSSSRDRRTRSSVDVRPQDVTTPTGSDVRPQSDAATPITRRRKLWNQFKNKTKKWRSRSAEKLRTKNSISQGHASYHESSMVRSHPDIWRTSQEFARRYSESAPAQDDDSLWGQQEGRAHAQEDRLDQGELDYSVPSPDHVIEPSRNHGNQEEKESEVDSGIAVVEQSVSTGIQYTWGVDPMLV